MFAKLQWDGDCLVYRGARDQKDYGNVGGSVNGQVYYTKAHRVVYAAVVGSIPDGLWVLHTCDNPPCCNPEHLYLGDHDQNMRDMVERGRSRKEPWDTCKFGHNFTPENTIIQRNGCKRCRTCQRKYDREYKRRRYERRT